MSRKPTIDRLREKNEAARLKLSTLILDHKAKQLAKYDATEPSRARRQPAREYKHEGEIYDMSKRLLGCNLGRDLERNYSPAKAMMHQFRVNVVGSLGKVTVNADGGDEATDYFNEVFAKDCDFRDDLNWSTMCQNVIASIIRDGDMLCVFDDGITPDDTGKLLTWESDQIVPVSDSVLAASPYKTAKQDCGILRDEWGRVVAYCVTGKRGLSVIDSAKDVSYYKRSDARLAKNPWRLGQGRGVPSLLTPSSNFIDLYEILASELQSAKRTAKQYAFVKRENAVTDWDDPASDAEFLPENDGRTSTEVAADGANQTTHTARNYERLETFTGGLTDYLDPKDTVEFPKLDHPNASLAAFLETVHGYGGAALGLARAYTILRADSSYTAFRGDMILSWATFYWLQKHIERCFADWVAIKCLTWAQRRGAIKPLAAGWERSISWKWPTMPEVDQLDYENAVAAALKNGTTNYAALLGPDWRKKMDDLADQLEYGRQKNLPLGIFEGKSGGIVENKKKEEDAMRVHLKGTDDE